VAPGHPVAISFCWRIMVAVIDEAELCKESTMKTKWLWKSWTHLVLVAIVAVEVFSINFALLYIVPRFRRFHKEGWLDFDRSESTLSWVPSFWRSLYWLEDYALWLIIAGLLIWALFEWRVRGENKSFIRLSALGTAALALTVPFVLTAAALVLPVMFGLPAMNIRKPEPILSARLASVEASVSSLEEAMGEKDWDAIREHARQASDAMNGLRHMGAAAPVIVSMKDKPIVDVIRAQLILASECLFEAEQASRNNDAAGLEAAMKKFHDAYGTVQATANPAK
jgi:hypothetical protein